MSKKIMHLLRRLSCARILKTTPERMVVVGIVAPNIPKFEKELLVNWFKTPLWKKVRMSAHSECARLAMLGMVDQSFSKGWIECFAFLDDMMRTAEAELKDQETKAVAPDTISMQGMDDDESSLF